MVVSYQHQGLVAVLEETEILELNQELRDVVLIYKETSEKHERNDQHWSQRHC
jgi:hypothetical protein